jgi:RNA 3'-terminal phosphate cyclase (ATP)
LRTALSLSALTGEELVVTSIRAGRRQPGLSPQHLAAVRAAASICQAELEGAELRSTEVRLRPGAPPRAGEYTMDVAAASQAGSAGSVTLLAQTVLIPLAAGAGGTSRLTLRGGTHVRWSPPYTYFEHVYLHALRRLGLQVTSTLKSWGFYPVGGGEIELMVVGPEAGTGSAKWQAVDWTDRGELERIRGEAIGCNLPAHIPQRMTDRARSCLADLGAPFAVTPRRVRGRGPGAGLFLVGEYEPVNSGFSSHGEKGKPSEKVAEEACMAFKAHHASGAPVDEKLADQLLLPLALIAGRSAFVTSTITEHLRTNAQIIRMFHPCTIEFQERKRELWEVVVDGNAWQGGFPKGAGSPRSAG